MFLVLVRLLEAVLLVLVRRGRKSNGFRLRLIPLMHLQIQVATPAIRWELSPSLLHLQRRRLQLYLLLHPLHLQMSQTQDSVEAQLK